MTSFLTQVQGFTPLIEVMVKEVGIIQAAVYGVVWRYCQRRDGVCTASHDTLAEALGLSRGTVQRHIKELCEAGYLRDTTPNRKNRPHVYADTGRAQIVGMVSAKVTVQEKHTTVSESDTQVYQKSTRRDCETTQETLSATAESPTLGLQIAPSPKKKKNGKPRDNDLYALARSLATVCLLDFDANKPKIFAEAKRLARVTPRPTSDLLEKHYGKGGTWYQRDWRGRKDQRPTLGQPRQTWLQLAVEETGAREFIV